MSMSKPSMSKDFVTSYNLLTYRSHTLSINYFMSNKNKLKFVSICKL